MEYGYRLKGLDCANCAFKIGQAAGELPGVTKAHVDFASQKLEITSAAPIAEGSVKQLVHQYEPDVVVVPWKNETAKEVYHHEQEASQGFKREWLVIGLSLALAAVGAALQGTSASLYYLFLVGAYLLSGYDIGKTAVKRIFQRQPLDETLLMTIATLGAWVLGDGLEAVGVMVFYRVGETLQNMAVHRSRSDIRALSALITEKAHLLKGTRVIDVPTEEIALGDLIEIRTGERVPVDGIVAFGEGALNTAALTGESLPVPFEKGDRVLSGSLNQGPLFHLEATHVLENSTVARILKMTQEEQGRKAAPERFLSKFAYYYTPSVVLLAFLIFLFPPLLGLGAWSTWAYRALLLLVISCPCALVLSVPLSYVAGMGKSAKEGFLLKGGTVLEALATVDTIAMDKTGTLTNGTFTVTGFEPVKSKEKDFFDATFLCESKAQHPLAKSIMNSSEGKAWLRKQKTAAAFDHYEEMAGKGVALTFKENKILCGSASFLEKHQITIPAKAQKAQVHTAKNGQYLGSVYLSDTLRPEAEVAIKSLSEKGIKNIYVLTGDAPQGTEILSSLQGITRVYPQLLPEDKVKIVANLQKEGKKVAFVGDGINDAPVLAAAQVGIAMGGVGSQAATEAADAVLASESLAPLPKALTIAKRTARIVRINVTLALVVKLAAMVLGIMGIANMWMALFADVGVSLICVLFASSVRLRKV